MRSAFAMDKGWWSVQQVNDVYICLHTGTLLKMNERRAERDNRDSIEHDLFVKYALG